jgi:hypothetical protein
MKRHLDKFYKLVAKNSSLTQEVESMTDRSDFANRLVKLGAKWGYTFTPAEVEASMKANTAPGQGDYFCLPIGCWRKVQSA